MKKCIKRVFVLALCMSLISSMLSGCFDVTSILNPSNEKRQDKVRIEEDVILYAAPGYDSDEVGMIESGKKVKYTSTEWINGIKWYETEDGWFTLGEYDGVTPTVPPVKGHVILTGFATKDLTLYDGASSSAEELGTMNAGELVEIYQTRDLWAQTVDGWVLFADVYVPGHIGKNPGWCFTTKTYIGCFSEPSFDSTRLINYKELQRIKLFEIIDIDGVSWGYTESGWICLEDTYIEGETGSGACRVKVIDKTPLNVRVGPSTRYDVVRTLDIGSYVDVLAQVHNGTDYWGFVGDGWIYMGLVEVQG